MSILKIHAREIFDSRGNPTVEVDLYTKKGLFRAAVPSGASTGIYEALELRDNDKTRYLGKGVSKAVEHINKTIAPALVSQNVSVIEQEKIDKLMLDMDGTENKSKFGANAILGVSLAVCKAGAAEKGVPLFRHIADLAGNAEVILPVPAFNVINGGSHAGNKLAMQEFMILPVGASSFKDAMRIGAEVYHNLKNVIKQKYGQDATNVGDEGGFAPNILENKEALELLKNAIGKAGYTDQIVIGMDVAASEFYKDGKYDLDFKSPDDPSRYITPDQLADLYRGFVKDYPVVSIEDPFDQDDWEAWSKFTTSTAIQVVGDDLTVTNPKRIAKAVSDKACNCLLLKVNQIGSVTESLQACVSKAVEHINKTIAPALVSQNVSVIEQEKIDKLMLDMDGTENKSKFGANAILGVSLAVCKAGAAEKGVPLFRHIADLAGNAEVILPVPAFNVINGGSHAGNKLAMQEFMILPVGASSFKDAMRIGAEVYHNLKNVIKQKYGQDATNVGDEGGFAPNILENKEALELLKNAIGKAGYTDQIVIGMDVAASEFYKDGKYDLDFKSPDDPSRYITPDQLADLYRGFVKDYPVVSIEDPFDQDDWEAWSKFTTSTAIQVVGDDLTVTNPKRIAKAVSDKACNCLLLKVNQIGSVTESLQAIEEELGDKARFAGRNFRNPLIN
ncbi:UNVERIFIED_CONTAM: hypothetical protein FKN15_059142 [Acipenser sinensis]